MKPKSILHPLNKLVGFGSRYLGTESTAFSSPTINILRKPPGWAGGVGWSPRDSFEVSVWPIGPTHRYFLHLDSIGTFGDGESGCDKLACHSLSHICHTLVTARFSIPSNSDRVQVQEISMGGSDGTPRHRKPSIEA